MNYGITLKSRWRLVISILVVFSSVVNSAEGQTLERFAVLPADTFSIGPTSGQFVAPANGRTPPFPNVQPVQGVSAVLKTTGNDFLLMSDNGFGAKNNSADYVLRVYNVSPDFRTKNGGSGTIQINSFMPLSDPNKKVNFPIVAEGATYPGSVIPVDPQIRQQRLLTGGDFDIESMRQLPDGTFWFGDEFGPFLLHTDANGIVLSAPIPLPGVQSPQNPFLGSGVPNLGSSRGFEGMALSPNGKTLYPMLEGSLTTDLDQRRLIISEFDVVTERYTGRRWFYRMENTTQSGQAIGDFTAVSNDSFLIIERDGGQGTTARFKKIFLVNLNQVDQNGFLVKHEVVNLLNIPDPDNVAGMGPVFTFPFVTIESVLPLSANHLAVLNDNNYPGSAGRTTGVPDNNEFIIIKLRQPLSVIKK